MLNVSWCHQATSTQDSNHIAVNWFCFSAPVLGTNDRVQ